MHLLTTLKGVGGRGSLPPASDINRSLNVITLGFEVPSGITFPRESEMQKWGRTQEERAHT